MPSFITYMLYPAAYFRLIEFCGGTGTAKTLKAGGGGRATLFWGAVSDLLDLLYVA